MALTTTTFDELDARISEASGRVVQLLRSVDPAAPLPGSQWTSRDVAGHLHNVIRRYTRRDTTSPLGLSARAGDLVSQNATDLADVLTLDHATIVDELAEEIKAYLATPRTALGDRFAFHGGTDVSIAASKANMATELLYHGADVARAAGRAWPISERDAILALMFINEVAPVWIDPVTSKGVSMAAVIRVPGTTAQRMQFLDGVLTVFDDDPSMRADVVIRSPARVLVPYLYGRSSLPAAARRGMLIIGGRRPWTGLQLRGYFLTP